MIKRCGLALLFIAVLAVPAFAQLACAALTIVAPFPPGSNTDAIARLVGERASETLRRPVIVDNRPGAEGQLAAVEVRRAPPDGCRVLFATSGNLSILPYIRREPPYDPLRDFTPIAEIGRYIFFLFASPALPGDVPSFVAAASARPGAFNFATANNTNLLAFAEIQRQFGLRFERVTYRGEPAAMTDLMQDRVQAMVATSLGVPHAREGRIRALAVLLPERSPLMPEVPTFAEAGIRDLGIVPWAGFVGPAGMAQPVADMLSEVLVGAMERTDVRDRAAGLGFTIAPARAAPFARLIREQHEVYGRVIRDVGLPAE
ncbi:MAG TPA: tripartite tricarboxylate transporter substrate binding protein [Acetobacteraceae bacterium]|nr:tripartite tricarboxylate transporter substrate binding protein [Acetobacteraceae bacterium]